jgi:hypothetical protein
MGLQLSLSVTEVYNNLPQNIKDTTEDIKGFEAKLKFFTFAFFLFITGIFVINLS